MKLYTSYYGAMKNLPNSILPISIARVTPSFFQGETLKKLAPSNNILLEYKSGGNEETYIQQYFYETLKKLTPENLINELKELADKDGKQDVCLLCYEKPESFCHRHVLSSWLEESGIRCEEYSYSFNP